MLYIVSRKSIIISLLGHLALFTIFGLSFGTVIPRANFTPVSFWGAVLGGSQVMPRRQPFQAARLNFLTLKSQAQLLNKVSTAQAPAAGYYLKPPITAIFNSKKITPAGSALILPPVLEKKEPALFFHPVLPYGFGLYFKDRQVAHVEIMFNIEHKDLRNSVAVKRKISSGNLEADLLCMRYIGHYLFIEQARFAPDNWQTVKIDLTKDAAREKEI